MKTTAIISCLLLVILFSCTQPPDYPPEPVIEFSHLSRGFMSQGFGPEDSIVMTISFTDGDGDLGSTDDSLDVFVTDTRLDAAPLTYKLPFVPLQGTGNGISGDISITLPTTCCIFPNNIPPPCNTLATFPQDTVVYEVYIKDRAGNESNRVLTDDIILLCD